MMKTQQKKRIIQKLWGWICLSINVLIITAFLADGVANSLTGGILLSISIICYGMAKTRADYTKDDLSIISVAIEYICVYIITFLAAYKASDDLSFIDLLIALGISSVVELAVFLFITYFLFLPKKPKQIR